MHKQMKKFKGFGKLPKRQISAPKVTDKLMAQVSKRDRCYFEKHPDAKEYKRPYVFGEFWPDLPPQQGQWVIVTQLLPGVRTRCMSA